VRRRKDGKLAVSLGEVALEELPALIASLQAKLANWRAVAGG
jgi:hypothetical protein